MKCFLFERMFLFSVLLSTSLSKGGSRYSQKDLHVFDRLMTMSSTQRRQFRFCHVECGISFRSTIEAQLSTMVRHCSPYNLALFNEHLRRIVVWELLKFVFGMYKNSNRADLSTWNNALSSRTRTENNSDASRHPLFEQKELASNDPY